MQKFALIAFSLIVLSSLVWYALRHPVTPPLLPSGAISSIPETFKEEAPYYTINAVYPSGIPAIKAWIDETVTQFKTDGNFENLTQEDIEMMGFDEGRQEALAITYEKKSSPHTESYVFSMYQDTGGAHPNTYYRTFTFDTRSHEELSLKDLFAPGAPYLEKLSAIARTRLKPMIAAREEVSVSEIDQEMLTDGTAPREDNFQNFYFDGSDFVLLFPPYAVGPYVLGSLTLPIPASDLRDILKPQYP